MSKYVIQVKEKPKCCWDCEHLHYSNEYDEKYCAVIDKMYGDIDIEKDCPITELKPRDLKWEDFHGDLKAKPFYEIGLYNNGLYYVSVHDRLYAEKYPLEVAKEICQKHFNELFYEMIGE